MKAFVLPVLLGMVLMSGVSHAGTGYIYQCVVQYGDGQDPRNITTLKQFELTSPDNHDPAETFEKVVGNFKSKVILSGDEAAAVSIENLQTGDVVSSTTGSVHVTNTKTKAHYGLSCEIKKYRVHIE